jgi:hypothetical protein
VALRIAKEIEQAAAERYNALVESLGFNPATFQLHDDGTVTDGSTPREG